MPQPLLGQRTRGELIAELYDRHAAGLFAYCHDQLGDSGSASAALAAVLDAVPDVEPPRAALYASARREIYLRDVVYAPPAAGTDPVAVFVERVLRDLRPHQREVLYLSGVCEMDTSELSWVLDVAADTADELTVSACRRFAQSLNLALASALVPDHLADVFGALPVAPVRDVLIRAPWAVPPAALRAAALRSQPGTAAAPPTLALRVKPLWPTTPAWPLPLPETAVDDESSPSDGFPDPFSFRDLPAPFAARDPEAVSAHEATTEPMPKLRDTVLTAMDDVLSRPRRPRLQRPRPRGAAPLPAPAPSASPLSAPLPADVLDDLPSENLFRPLTPEARAARLHTDRLVASAPRAEAVPDAFRDRSAETATDPTASEEAAQADPPLPGWPLRVEELDAQARTEQAPAPEWPEAEPAPSPERPATDRIPSPEWPDVDWAPYAKQPRDDTRRPKHAAPWSPEPEAEAEPETEASAPDGTGTTEPEAGTGTAQAARRERAGGRARHKHRPAREGRHYDWMWELVGFLVCVAIAMLVFFLMPTR
ncbi:DNA-directed RNA polymerase specialized sigma24 family protein [Streptosporangium album]|uniref:DNA-directed RNA polymerase specialized sigma24 family protein n=1 Tax=Streptosporangium album TaxID=47479 RepID=A0A7W7RSR1_9ACTN|nr:hypothetical protein [Streptosporangium album]MBB4937207.1 DNA-directed RNA polymerase specialized sigma24 family protein [Streptosporangium album]